MGILDKQLLNCCRLSYDFAEVSLGFPLLVNATLVERDGGLFKLQCLLCRSELAPGGVPTKVVNDDAFILSRRGVADFFASNRASTGCSYRGRVSRLDYNNEIG
jgi:hypothetical protein